MRTILLLSFFLLPVIILAQPGRDLEYKGEHPVYHYSDSFPLIDYQYIDYVMDSVPPEDRVYVTYDTLEGILLNGHRCSVYEFPSILRYALANPAGKDYFPSDVSRATVMLLLDYPIANVMEYPPSFRTQSGQQFMLGAILSVMYDIWNEDARYAEDKTFDLLSESQREIVVARNPHRIQWINFSDEYFSFDPPLLFEPESWRDSTLNYTEIRISALPEDILLLNGEEMDPDSLAGALLVRMKNKDARPDWPSSPAEAVILLENDRDTGYDFYLQTYHAIRSVYDTLWEEEAQKLFGRSYEQLSSAERMEIRAVLPMLIQEQDMESSSND